MYLSHAIIKVCQKTLAITVSILVLSCLLGGTAHAFTSQDVVNSINAYRNSHGMESLQNNASLHSSSSNKAQHMLTHQYWSHDSPEGTEPWHFFHEASYKYVHAGENLALGFSDVQALVDAWSQSDTHNGVMLNKTYTEIGVSVSPGTINETNGPLIVAHFGTRTSPTSQLILGKVSPNDRSTLLDIPIGIALITVTYIGSFWVTQRQLA